MVQEEGNGDRGRVRDGVNTKAQRLMKVTENSEISSLTSVSFIILGDLRVNPRPLSRNCKAKGDVIFPNCAGLCFGALVLQRGELCGGHFPGVR